MANGNPSTDPIILTNQSPELDSSTSSQMPVQNGNIPDVRPSSENKIYHFHNCRIMDSFNTRTIAMDNCGNKLPQVTICSSFFPFSFLSSFINHDVVVSDHRVSGNEKSDKKLYFESQPHAVSSNSMWVLSISLYDS